MENLNNQRQMEREVLGLVKRYNTLYKRQIYAFFRQDGRDAYVGKALKALEKEQKIYINPDTRMVAANENSYQAGEPGTMQAVWVLLSLMKQKKIEEHFLVSREEYPVRIVFVGDAELYDILYISRKDAGLADRMFAKRDMEKSGHIVVVESPEDIPAIDLSGAIGFCTVKEDGEVEYYKKGR